MPLVLVELLALRIEETSFSKPVRPRENALRNSCHGAEVTSPAKNARRPPISVVLTLVDLRRADDS
jgi:hypothetical protein